jgi:hypothetical protein
MLKASLYLDKRYRTRKGYPLKVRFYKDNQYHYTEGLIYIKDWKDGKPIQHSDYQFYNSKLSSLIDEEKFCFDNNLSTEECKRIFKNGLDNTEAKEIEIAKLRLRIKQLENGNDRPFKDVFLEFLNSRKENEDLDSVRNAYNQFKKYAPKCTINQINENFAHAFVRWLQNNGVKNGAISYLASLGSIYRFEKGKRVENPFYLVRPKKLEQKKKRPLSKDDIILLEGYTSNYKNRLNRVKVFLLQFYFGGMDLIDLANLTYSENVHKGRITTKRWKNRNKELGGASIDIKIFPKAQALLDYFKRDYSDRLVPFIPTPIKDGKRTSEYDTFLGHNNSPLRFVAKELGISQGISSKVSRNTFKTIGRRDLKLDNEILMQIQGHTLKGMDKRYQDLFDYDSQDEVHFKVIDTTTNRH